MKLSIKPQILVIFLSVSLFAVSQSKSRAYLDYIDQYHQLAERQQREHGIPASIILAQGLLESGAGQSTFAKESNNHFGIKCSDWTGDKYYHDDETKNECFRKYNQVLESYEDHSLFLKKRSRYAFLFSLNPTDYEGWAQGLKKAGYATDPAYAYKLISIIENYELHQYDLVGSSSAGFAESRRADDKSDNTVQTRGASMGVINAVTIHTVVKVNKVKFVTSVGGDTYATIANEFNMTENRLRGFNEVNSTVVLKPGMRVFIEMKRNKAPKENNNHTVTAGESMYSISQDYGMKVVSLYKLNNMSFTDGVRLGQVLVLR
ncbi:Mannosyl-glycoprotein endo-beta-N-acetylglucosamidase [Paludibacter propionicigenes WB4]|uniref:Peptidoglycan hydrolase n=1 Tax=Paludibacter propionicigenes (strain DSM 17365 / JCM 13257 / WB4) TaxID=694427 RepID=E4T341_PALPW|nr:glucosaminidase domain-containing protein [Paludibacter propionicigenes]ADQ79135.1 Mannosyl-glycoprotein endo-beta-N-acetylglucosamidase [Paludibacter propionicigenes WB4]